MDSFSSIINASFDKIMFLAGLVLIMITIFGSKPIIISKIKIPALDNIGRIISGVVGLLLICASVYIWFFSFTNIGLISTPPNAKSLSLLQIIKPAYAQPEEITIQQYRISKITIKSGEQLGIYVDNINPTSPSRLLLFNIQSLKPELWDKKLNYDFLKRELNTAIIFEGLVTQEGEYPFLYHNEKYTLYVKKVFWYLFGSDYMTIDIK